MRSIALLVGGILGACAAPTDPDLDGDGVTDDEDDCPAGFPDEAVDIDLDGKDATVDLCPHDTNALAGDLDGDNIPEQCDPFPGEAKLDTRRCITSYRVRWMNAAHFQARAGEKLWNLTPPLTAANDESVSMMSTFRLEKYRTVSFDIVGTVHFREDDPTASFRLWLRAVDEAPSEQDVACGIAAGANGMGEVFVWAGNTRNATRPLLRPIVDRFRLRATVQARGAGVLCRILTGDAVFDSRLCTPETCVATTFAATVQDNGSYGFASINSGVTIESVVIDSNDSMPSF